MSVGLCMCGWRWLVVVCMWVMEGRCCCFVLVCVCVVGVKCGCVEKWE